MSLLSTKNLHRVKKLLKRLPLHQQRTLDLEYQNSGDELQI